MLTTNLFLVALIIFLAYLNFYREKIHFSCGYGTVPENLLTKIKEEFPSVDTGGTLVVFSYNQLPTKSDIETMEKLNNKLKPQVSVLGLFHKRFDYDKEIGIIHKFLPGLTLVCSDKPKLAKSNYFMILNQRKILHLDTKFDLSSMFFTIQKIHNPKLGYKDMAISGDDLKKKITQRLKKGNLPLIELSSGNSAHFSELSDISKVYFVHANCSSCQLKSLFSDLKLRNLLDSDKKQMVIFSIFADRHQLKPFLSDYSIGVPIYLDTNDEFELYSTITNDKENPLIIDLNTEM